MGKKKNSSKLRVDYNDSNVNRLLEIQESIKNTYMNTTDYDSNKKYSEIPSLDNQTNDAQNNVGGSNTTAPLNFVAMTESEQQDRAKKQAADKIALQQEIPSLAMPTAQFEGDYNGSIMSKKDRDEITRLQHEIDEYDKLVTGDAAVDEQHAQNADNVKREKRNKIKRIANQDTNGNYNSVEQWLDPDYKMTDSEIEAANKMISDYEATARNLNVVDDATEEEKYQAEYMSALKDKVSKAEAVIYGAENAMPGVDALLKALDDKYRGWTTADMTNEVAIKRNVNLTADEQNSVNAIDSEIERLKGLYDKPDTFTGDAGVDEAYTSQWNDKVAKQIDDLTRKKYAIMIEGGQEPKIDTSYSARKENVVKQNPVEYYAGDIATRAAETVAGQAILGGTGYGKAIETAFGDTAKGKVIASALEDLPVDIATDTIPEYLSNKASGMSDEELTKRLLINIGMNLGINFGVGILQNADTLKNAVKESGVELTEQEEAALNTLIDSATKETDDVVEIGAKEVADDIPQLSQAEMDELQAELAAQTDWGIPTVKEELPKTVEDADKEYAELIVENPNWNKYTDDVIPMSGKKGEISESAKAYLTRPDSAGDFVDASDLSRAFAERGYDISENGFNNDIAQYFSELNDMVSHGSLGNDVTADSVAQAFEEIYLANPERSFAECITEIGERAKQLDAEKGVKYIGNTGRIDYSKTARGIVEQSEVIPDENVAYHSGTLSRLNKAETRGKMQDATRDTGYYGTGHYFVDSAHKKELGSGTGYYEKPWSSIDMSKAGNLYKANDDATADALHSFSQRYTRNVIGKETDLDELYSDYQKLFPNSPMPKDDFIKEIDDFKMTEADNYLENREDSVFTQFMKKRGYNGVDTRGTKSADTLRGIVVYDLPEESIIKSNVTDDAIKDSGMAKKESSTGNRLFDETEDAKIQKAIDEQEKERLVKEEYHKAYDDTALKQIKSSIESKTAELKNAEDAYAYYKKIIDDPNYAESEIQKVMREFESMNLPMEKEEAYEFVVERAKENLNECSETADAIRRELEELETSLATEEEKSLAAYKAASDMVNSTDSAEGIIPKLDEIADTDAGETIPDIRSGEMKESRYATESIPNKSDLPDEIKETFRDDPELYEAISNKNTEAAADEILANSRDLQDAKFRCEQMIAQRNPVSIPLGYKVAKELIDDGRTDEAVSLIRYMSQELTKSGQFTQSAAIMLMNNDPMTALKYIQSELDRINDVGASKYKKWVDFALTDDEYKALAGLERGDSEGIKEIFDQVGDRISKEYPASMYEKFVELRHLSMLLNLRTHIKNTTANVISLGVRSASDRVSAIGQNFAHLINPDIKVTQSLTGSIGGKYKEVATDVWDQVKEAILNGGKYQADASDGGVSGLLSEAVKKKQVFKDTKVTKAVNQGTGKLLELATGGKVSQESILKFASDHGLELTDSTLENLRQLDYWLLGVVEDDPFVKKNFVNRLASYMKAQKITSIENVPEEAIETATIEALKATFKDDNALTSAFASFKKRTGILGEVAMPFSKTPANLAMRSYEYSPAGIISTVKKSVKENKSAVRTLEKAEKALSEASTPYAKKAAQDAVDLANKNLQKIATDTIDDLSKNVTGTALIGAGIALANAGIITGKYDDDPDTAAFQKQRGYQEYALHFNIGGKDHYYTYDWAQPTSIGLIIGTEIVDAMKSLDNENATALEKAKNVATGIGSGSIAAVDAWFDQSPLQSLQEIMGGGDYSDDSIGQNIVNQFLDLPGSMIPALSGAVARSKDPIMRQTTDQTSKLKTLVNEAKAKIPTIGDDEGLTGLWNKYISSESIPVSYDTWGRERRRSENEWDSEHPIKSLATSSWFGQMVNPGQYGYNNSTPIDDTIQALGDKYDSAFPHKIGSTKKIEVDGKEIALNNKQVSDYQKNTGTLSYEGAEQFVNSSEFSSIPEEDQAEILSKIYGLSDRLTERDLFGKSVSGSEYTKLEKEYDEGGMQSVVDALISSQKKGEIKGFLEGNTNLSDASVGATALANAIPYLDNSDYTDEEKGKYLYETLKPRKDNKELFDRKDYVGIWNYYNKEFDTK